MCAKALKKNLALEKSSSRTVTFEKTPAAPTTSWLALGGAGNVPLRSSEVWDSVGSMPREELRRN